MNFTKKVFFISHLLYIISSLFGWIIHSYLLVIPIITLASWHINGNECLITKLEYYLFCDTITGGGPNFRVPYMHRIVQKMSFVLGCYYCLKSLWIDIDLPEAS